MNVQDIIGRLGLVPHPEGGFFREVYRSTENMPTRYLPARYAGGRSVSTAIYYLLTPDTFSTMHRVQSDEVFHFYLGDTVQQLRLYDDGSSETIHLGSDILQGELVQSLVPRGVWQGASLVEGGKFALLGATVAPGFDFADYEEGTKKELTRKYPAVAQLIDKLTRR